MALRLTIQRRLPLVQGWPVCFGMPGRFGSEWVAVLCRNTHVLELLTMPVSSESLSAFPRELLTLAMSLSYINFTLCQESIDK